MSKQKAESGFPYSLIPLTEFKAIFGMDYREDLLARFCLVTSTLTIEQYCKRRLLRKKKNERIEYLEYLRLSLNGMVIYKL